MATLDVTKVIANFIEFLLALVELLKFSKVAFNSTRKEEQLYYRDLIKA